MLDTIHTPDRKELFLREIKASEVIIPDLYALFPSWKFDINTNYETVKIKTDKWIDSWVTNDTLQRRMKIANFAKLGACLYPHALAEECLMMSYYHLWIFNWDDELDCGPLTNDPNMALLFKKDTDAALDYTLGEHPFNGHPPPMAPIISAFSTVAEKVVAGITTEARQRLLSALKYYVDGACIMPSHRSNTKSDLLTIKGFLKQREASGGCGPSIALAHYVYHLNIPVTILDHEAMRTIRDQTCMLVHTINDIVSFHKELMDNQIDNIVLVLAIENRCSLQEAIDGACELVRNSRIALESAEKRAPIPTGNADLDGQIKQYIQASKDLVTGLVSWSYSNERYFGKNTKQEGNKIFL